MNRAIRAGERAHRAHVRAQAAQARESVRQHNLQVKAVRQAYLGNRIADVEADNAQLAQMDAALQCLLAVSLRHSSSVNFAALHRVAEEKVLDERMDLRVGRPPVRDSFMPQPLGFFSKLFPSAVRKHEQRVERAAQAYAAALEEHQEVVRRRQSAFEALEAEVATHNQEVDEFRDAVADGRPEALVSYAEMVLDSSAYPEGFPQDFKVGLVPESKQLVVDYELPRIDDIISEYEQFKYVRTSDSITAKKKPEKARSASYVSTIAQVTLRTLHELFKADGLHPIESIVFSGFVKTIDPATGHAISPYLISVRATREKFQALELGSVDPIACLKSLSAAVSRSPKDLVAVRPIVEFNMIDPRFVSEQDILSTLDARPNLMELTPGEFESLITNLFQSMGLETKLTQASRDGGVDCVAYDARPILGGKVVVQAKRYRHTVGVSAVRDLFGTMHNEGASKGILVTTSGFGSAAFTFANGKPIELVTGSNLLFLLKEHAGVDAKIEAPPDWVDAVADAPEPEAI